jgi:hypothetical protein
MRFQLNQFPDFLRINGDIIGSRIAHVTRSHSSNFISIVVLTMGSKLRDNK